MGDSQNVSVSSLGEFVEKELAMVLAPQASQ
jgi:hypothetical protein